MFDIGYGAGVGTPTYPRFGKLLGSFGGGIIGVVWGVIEVAWGYWSSFGGYWDSLGGY